MALGRFLVILLLGAPLLFFTRAELGVNYGTVANDLPDPASVTQLFKDNGITMVRIYDTDPRVLTSLANTGIKVMVMLPNENLAAAADDPSYALQWVKSNVAAYSPATQIHSVAVGNEVFDSMPADQYSKLVPAMTNVQLALAQLGLADAVKVSTPLAFTAVTNSYPPSSGRFRDDVAQSVMKPMLQFLKQTSSYLTINLYPFWAYYNDPEHISLDYALGNPNTGVPDPVTNLRYYNLLDAERDAAHYAMDDLVLGVSLYVSENGQPSQGKVHKGGPTGAARRGGMRRLQDGDDDVFSVANAQAYINNVINRVLAGQTGTPHRPDADMDLYIFALFNENQKGNGPDDIEQNFGLFYPNMTKVYGFDFHGGDAPKQTWCVANAAVGDARLQAALDYACGNGADCGAIQPGATCFQPDTKVAHASYAFNDYYQRNGRAAGTCDFNGAASVVNRAPDICWSWCVANAAVGAERLQASLDFACGHGADCSAIQPGAACFQPDTKLAHASYAFNSYYQNMGRAAGTCNFNGAGSIVYQPQKVGNCVLPPPNS